MGKVRYAIGQQSFEVLRQRGAVYVDKTRFIQTINESGAQYYFLARPRRFGKSLFLSTLKCFYGGKRELFHGLHIDSYDWTWEKYPILHIDLNITKYTHIGELEDVLDSCFRKWEEEYHVEKHTDNLNVRFKEIIEGAHRFSGRKVVVLVDEYDKPLIGNIEAQERFEYYRDLLQSIYSNFKNCADHIQLVFLTGVSRFSKLSIFSGLNNLKDITLLDEYNEICGITERELHENLQEGIRQLGEANHMSYAEAAECLKDNYDGYRFSKNGADIYNPWSLLNALDDKEISNYWNRTGGISTIIAESLRRMNVNLQSFFHTQCSVNDMEGMDLMNPNPLALLYQTGYITIKDFDPRRKRFTLGIPNREVTEGLMNGLLPYYANLRHKTSSDYIWRFSDALEDGDANKFMDLLNNFFSSITYELHMDNENNLQNAIFVLLSLLGLEVKAEEKTSNGRIDLFLETDRYIYIIELKYDKSAQDALDQIEHKEYDLPFRGKGKEIVKIGANFDSATRRLGDWTIVPTVN